MKWNTLAFEQTDDGGYYLVEIEQDNDEGDDLEAVFQIHAISGKSYVLRGMINFSSNSNNPLKVFSSSPSNMKVRSKGGRKT